MDVILPRSRRKHKEGRSRSLPARINLITSMDLPEQTEISPTEVHPTTESKHHLHPGDTAFNSQAQNEELYPQSHLFYDWSRLKPDERGAELAEEARVWKVYVGETDKSDRELVDGWDKSMDVLLVFATLFSAISTAFLIESSKMLKQDPNDVAAAALLAISQTVAIIATNNSPANSPTVPSPDQDSPADFVPPRTAVIVNTLWFMSLSLSIATAFLAMLAKDWCHSFISHRMGPPRDQAHRRQRKWKLIERWKMKKLIVGLPSLMHLTLLLFSVGLCIYLWDLNRAAAIPVICVVAAFLAFYIWSSITASVVEDFPYTTIISQIFRSDHVRILSPIATASKQLVVIIFIALAYITGLALWIVSLALGIVIAVLASPLVLLDRLSFRLFVKTWKHALRVFFICAIAAFFPIGVGLELLQRLHLSISSYASRISQRLKLTEELTTSLTLSWLIQNCETPSAVDVALQAIAGASQRIPKEPLLSSQATVKIIRRLVSYNASDSEKSRYNLYTRGLEFLDRNPGPPSSENGQVVAGDLEVLVWELKSRNERKIAELVQDGSFRPSADNLESMRIGNSAPSQCLRFLMGEAKGTTESFDSIITLLSRHSGLNDKQLHPAAVHSLANAAALHTSLSAISELPPDLVGLCMNYCEKATYKASEESTEVIHNFGSEAALAICVLLHYRPTGNDVTDATLFVPNLNTRAWRAICALIDVYTDNSMGNENLSEYIFWIACLEILSNRPEYGLNNGNGDWKTLQQWCNGRASNFVREWGTLDSPFRQHKKRAKEARATFLAAVSQVYDLLEETRSHNSAIPHLPEPLHTALVIIGCDADDWQSEKCYEILAKFGFPKLSEAYIASLEIPTRTFSDADTALSTFDEIYTDSAEPRDQRQFVAAQLWLLLQLAGDSSSPDQQRLKAIVDLKLPDSLRSGSKGLDLFERELESCIIEGYRRGHLVGKKSARSENESLSLWDKLKTGILEWQTGKVSQQQPRRPSTRLSRFENTLETKPEDHRPGQKYHRVYIARVVERILEVRGLQGNEELVPYIQDDLRTLPVCFQKLSPTLVPLPSSRATSRSSVREKLTIVTYTSEKLHATESGHVSVEVQDPPGLSTAGGNVSDSNFAIAFNESPESL